MLKGETDAALELARSKEPFWEYLLSAELLEPRKLRAKREIEDVRKGRVLGAHRTLKGRPYMDWVTSKFIELSCTLHKIESVFTKDLVESWGPSGVPGKSAEIFGAAIEVDSTLRALVSIESDIFRTHALDVMEPVRQAMLGMTDDILAPVQTVPSKLRDLVDQGRSNEHLDPPLVLNLLLKFEFTGETRFKNALESVKNCIGPADWE
jgi:hypothetical protein